MNTNWHGPGISHKKCRGNKKKKPDRAQEGRKKTELQGMLTERDSTGPQPGCLGNL